MKERNEVEDCDTSLRGNVVIKMKIFTVPDMITSLLSAASKTRKHEEYDRAALGWKMFAFDVITDQKASVKR